MIRPDGGEVENHHGEALVLAEGQDARHLRFAVRNPALLLADGLDALRQHEEALVDARRLRQPVLSVVRAPVVLRARQIDGRDGADPGLLGRRDRNLDAQNGVGARGVGIELFKRQSSDVSRGWNALLPLSPMSID